MNKLLLSFAFIMVACAALIIFTDNASATTVCHATGNWCQGYAHARALDITGTSARCFALRTTNTAPTCATGGITPINEATWEMVTGSCVTFYYFDTTVGAAPPAVPNKVTILVSSDDTDVNVRVYQSAAAEPTTGTSYSFCSTSNGVSGSAARAGTFKLVVNAVKDDGPGGIGNYAANSNTGGANADRGALRGQMLVSSVSRNAYPAGSTYAYGPAGDETITITSTFTQPNTQDASNLETMRNGIYDSATRTVGENGATVDIDSTTTLAQNFIADNTYPFGNTPYVAHLDIIGPSGLTSLSWTVYAATGHGGGLTRLSDTVIYDGTFDIDSRIHLDSDGAGTFATADETDKSYVTTCTGGLIELYNRGETMCHEWYIFNARSELLSRAMTFARLDAVNTQCSSYGSLTPTTNKYTRTEAIPTAGSCLVAADITGSSRHLRVTNTDQTYDSGIVFYVSSLLRFDSDGTGSVDNIFKTCLGVAGCPGASITVFNRQERVDCEGYLINARGTQYQVASVAFKSFDSLGAQNAAQTLSPTSGLYSCSDFLLSSTEKATADTVGDPHYFTAVKDGNTATTISNDYGVSSLYFVDAHIEKSATLVKDNFPTEDSTEDLAYIISNAVTDTTHGWCHVVTVRKDVDIDTGNTAITWSYIDPLSATRFSGTTGTGSDGWTPTHLDLLASTPLGNWHFSCVVSDNGNSGSDSELFTVQVPAGTGGFQGDPLRLLCAPIITNPGETVTCVAAESNSDGSLRTGNAAGTLYDIYNPSNTAVVTGGATTEVSTTGNYRFTYSPGGSPALGSYIVIVRTTDASPISSSTVFFIETDPTLALATTTQLSNTQTTITTAISNSQSTITGAISSSQTTITNAINTLSANNTDYHGHLNEHLHNVSTDFTPVIDAIEELNTNNTDYHNHLNYHLHNVNTTIGNVSIDNSQVLQELQEHRENSLEIFSMENIMLLIFFVLMIISEWKKDLMYHLLTAILGIFIVAMGAPEIPRLVLIGLLVYQLIRIFRIFENGRNTLSAPNEGDLHE